MKLEELQQNLKNIEINLARIEVHLQDIKIDVNETKAKAIITENKVSDLENFKSKSIGAASIVLPVVAFIAAIGHDIIKRFMGWG